MLPSQFARYDITKEKLPEKIRNKTGGYLFEVASIIQEEVPKVSTIYEVLSLPFGRGWGYKNSEKGVRLLVYGTFRNDYRVISAVAEILADFYSVTSFIPIVVPIRKPTWERYLRKDDKFVGLLSRQGVLTYSRFFSK